MLAKPDHCRPCAIAGNMRGFILPSGTGRIPLLLVGEGGGATEEKRGQPFIGAAGEVLSRACRIVGLNRDDFTIGNLLSCRPPNNALKGAPYEFAALNHCRPFLNATVAERQPRIIVALGDVPLRELSLTKGSISELRGYVFDSIYSGIKIIGTYHPSHLLQRKGQPSTSHLLPVLMHDLRVAHQIARHGVPEPMPTQYQLTPTLDDVEAFTRSIQPSDAIAYDIETASILGENESDDWREKRIVQIQFSTAAGQAIVMPWTEPFIDAARYIMALPNDKLGWNSRLSDDPCLRANSIEIGGESYDAMLMFAHLQPNWVSSRDGGDDDKGVPSRLLNLQSAVSFYYPQETPYKATMRTALHGGVAVWDDIRYGGARDCDLTLRLGLKLMASLRRQGLWDGFYRYKHTFGQVLMEMSERGLPIDRTAQTKLRAKIEETEAALEAELQRMIPLQLKPFKEYRGWPKDLREAVKAAGLYVKRCQPHQFPEHVTDCGYELKPFDDGSFRLCKPLPFNPRSSDQILSYIQHKIDTVGSPYFIPLHIETKQPTTNKAGIEALLDATDDPVLKQIEKCKKVSKLKDYCGDKWQPKADGCVHAEFRVGATATGQTTATNPPIQTYPKHVKPEDEWLVPLIKQIKSIIAAPAGHIMVETDLRGFHSRMQAFLAEDEAYYRLSTLDTHSFVTGQYVGVPDKDTMLALDDEALLKRLKEIKAAYAHERNYMVKRISFLNQYGGGAEKASTILRIPRMEVQAVLDVMRDTFKPAFRDLPKKIDAMIDAYPRLTNAFGLIRWFWERDINQAIAFWVASPAHCHIQDAAMRLHDRGALRRFNAVNFMHDAIWWCPRVEDAEECIAVAKEELERPSEVLVNSLGAFSVKADASYGPHMAAMDDV